MTKHLWQTERAMVSLQQLEAAANDIKHATVVDVVVIHGSELQFYILQRKV